MADRLTHHLATCARFTAVLLRGAADGLEQFARSLTVQRTPVPDEVPDWLDTYL